MPWDLSDAEAKDAQLESALDDMGAVTAEWADIASDAIKKNFEKESAGSSKWEPLAPSTIADRRRKGFADGPILKRTGNLKEAATSVKEHNRDSAEVGFEDGHPYAEFHMGEGERRKIPLRDALVLEKSEIDAIERALVDQLQRHAG